MKTTLLLALLAANAPLAYSQGPISPSGAPAPTMKSLQELWDNMEEVKAQNTFTAFKLDLVQQQNSLLQSDIATLQQQNQALTSLLAANAAADLPWSFRSAGGTYSSNAGSYSSLAITPDGQIRVSLVDEGASTLSYARATAWRAGSSLILEPITTGDTFSSTSIALDAAGNPAIAYIQGDPLSAAPTLKCARFNGTAWSFTTVQSLRIGFYKPSIAFTPSGQPAIAYEDYPNASNVGPKALRYAVLDGSTWTINTVLDPTGAFYGGTALAYYPDGRAAITYGGSTTIPAFHRTLNLAVLESGTWTHSVVEHDSTGGQGMGEMSLAISPGGKCAISYFLGGIGIKCAISNGGTWDVSTVAASDIYPAQYSTVSFSQNGHPAVAYAQRNNILFASYNGAWWTRTTVDTAVSTASGFNPYSAPSLAFMPDGAPVISYQYQGALRLAKRHP